MRTEHRHYRTERLQRERIRDRSAAFSDTRTIVHNLLSAVVACRAGLQTGPSASLAQVLRHLRRLAISPGVDASPEVVTTIADLLAFHEFGTVRPRDKERSPAR